MKRLMSALRVMGVVLIVLSVPACVYGNNFQDDVYQKVGQCLFSIGVVECILAWYFRDWFEKDEE